MSDGVLNIPLQLTLDAILLHKKIDIFTCAVTNPTLQEYWPHIVKI